WAHSASSIRQHSARSSGRGVEPIRCRCGAIADRWTSRAPSGWERGLITVIVEQVLALWGLVSAIFWSAVLTGRVRRRQRHGVLSPDPGRAALGVGGNVAVMLQMLGFLVFPDGVVLVAAVMLPVWIVLLVVGLRV